jgi:hypothetical protein
VTPAEPSLAHSIVAYGAGLDAEIGLLRQLDALSDRQRTATDANDIEGLARCTDERTALMSALVKLEFELKPVRDQLARSSTEAAGLPGFATLVRRHREAAALVATILQADEKTLEALRQAEHARRLAAQAIETGETTLAAYRRVVAPSPASAALLDERG